MSVFAHVTGTLVSVYTSKSGVTYLDFCKNYKTCPFSGVIFSDDRAGFSDLHSHVGSQITISGKIASYQGRAEIVLDDPSQLSK